MSWKHDSEDRTPAHVSRISSAAPSAVDQIRKRQLLYSLWRIPIPQLLGTQRSTRNRYDSTES